MSQAATVAAFAGDQAPIAGMREVYQQRRDRMLELLAPITGLTFTPPDEAFYVFANVSALMGKTTEIGETIQNKSELVAYLLNLLALTRLLPCLQEFIDLP